MTHTSLTTHPPLIERGTLFLGVDVGSISTKAVAADSEGAVVARSYIWTEGDPIRAAAQVVREIAGALPGDAAKRIGGVGVTGSARKLVGLMLGADIVKNEITAHAVGTLSRRPDTRTIIEIGGQDSKLIVIENGVVTDYAMNTLCAAGTGAFLSSQAHRLGLEVEQFGDIARQSANPAKLAARCTVFAETDLIHKLQSGYRREDIVAGLCRAVAVNYLNNIGKGKRITAPVAFQGGVSKNSGVQAAFEQLLGMPVAVDPDSHLMGALGAALLAKQGAKSGTASVVARQPPAFELARREFRTESRECGGCANNCELVRFYRDGELIDTWGGICGKYEG